jgi:hypothetical protein
MLNPVDLPSLDQSIWLVAMLAITERPSYREGISALGFVLRRH